MLSTKDELPTSKRKNYKTFIPKILELQAILQIDHLSNQGQESWQSSLLNTYYVPRIMLDAVHILSI